MRCIIEWPRGCEQIEPTKLPPYPLPSLDPAFQQAILVASATAKVTFEPYRWR